jgi:hypothetical protein
MTTELAHRTGDGIDIHLFWDEQTDRVTVAVFDTRTDNGFELEVEPRRALDAFNHPYAYAARSDAPVVGEFADASRQIGSSQDATTNPRRNDHARTDR